VFGAVQQGRGARRQAGLGQRRIEGGAHDGPRGAQRVRADAEHHGVAGTDHARGVGEDVGPALEDEARHAQGRDQLLNAPALVVNAFDPPPAAGVGVLPGPEPRDHVGPHGRAHRQTGRRAPAGPGLRHILGVGRGDFGPGSLVLQPRGEGLEEGADRLVRDGGKGVEGGQRPAYSARRGGVLGLGHVQERAVDHQQPVARPEGRRQRFGDMGHLVAAPDDGHAGRKRLQPPGGGDAVRPPCAAVVHHSAVV
jgi:hypothetical protein